MSATESVNGGAWRDLSNTMHANMPYPSYFPPPSFELVSEADGRGTPRVTQLTVCTHMGTHIDAPSHFIPGARPLDGFGLDRFALEAVVWAFEKDPNETIDVADLALAAPTVRPGDAVLLATGWGEKWGTPDYREHPYLTPAAGRWLVDAGVALLGLDVMTPDMPVAIRPAGYTHPVHDVLLRNEVLIVENLVGLGELAGYRIEFQALPLKLDAADGSPVRAVARPLA